MTNGTVLTRQNNLKKIKVGIWNKPVCLGCSKPLTDDRFNSSNYIGSLCGKCHKTVKEFDFRAVLPDFTKPEAV